MAFVSITRLRVRSIRFMPAFALGTRRSIAQLRQAPGFVAGKLLADRKWTFWTMSLWRDHAAMRAYMASGDHREVMPRLLHWGDEASVVHWDQDGDGLPEWREAARRMRAEGRPSQLRHRSPQHADLSWPEPRTRRGTTIVPLLS